MKSLPAFVFVLLATACDSSNTSTISADYATLRVKELALTDRSGKTVVMITGEHDQSGSPVVVLKDVKGVVLKTIRVE